jgi:hypothetical protein
MDHGNIAQKALAKMQAAHGTEACRAAVCRQRSDLLMVQPSPAVMYGAEVGHDEGGQRQDVMVKESSPQHS